MKNIIFLIIFVGTEEANNFVCTFGYETFLNLRGIRRPSAPYQLAAYDWTCDRAPIALEKDPFFSCARIFLIFGL